jgi:hypothetical protein
MQIHSNTRLAPAVWGILGVLVLLGSAVYRLTPVALEALSLPLGWHHWAALAVVLFFMAYVEGYQAFQLGFSPRVAARARYLLSHNNRLHAVLAPLFCMSYFYARKRRQIVSLSVTAGIIILIVLVRMLPQPWRGIVDAGVVVGLAWGLVSLVVFGVRALTSDSFPHSPEVPDERRD